MAETLGKKKTMGFGAGSMFLALFDLRGFEAASPSPCDLWHLEKLKQVIIVSTYSSHCVQGTVLSALYINSFHSYSSSVGVSINIFFVRKLRHRNVKEFIHPASECWSWTVNPGILAPTVPTLPFLYPHRRGGWGDGGTAAPEASVTSYAPKFKSILA